MIQAICRHIAASFAGALRDQFTKDPVVINLKFVTVPNSKPPKNPKPLAKIKDAPELGKDVFSKSFKAAPAFLVQRKGKALVIKGGTKVSVGAKVISIRRNKAIGIKELIAGRDYVVSAFANGDFKAAPTSEKQPLYSRAIGGFHVDLGGKILEHSIWDLSFRPKAASPQGMVLVDGKYWVDIYLTDRNGQSTANSEPADGREFKPHGFDSLNHKAAVDLLAKQGKELLSREEFALAADGSTQGAVCDDKTKLTARVKGLTSKWGLEQATGCLWVWSREKDNDGWPYILGGSWCYSGDAGPRLVGFDNPNYSFDGIGARGRCDHLQLA